MKQLEQQSAEWLEMRKSHIGASDAPVIMGVSPWKTPYQLWEEKMGIKTSNFSSAAMQRGLDLEDDARKFFADETGIEIEPAVIFHSERKWMMASLDGLSVDARTLVEIKCPGKQDHSTALSGEVPEKYMPQLQHQIEVAQLDKGYYLSYDGSHGVIIEVGRDEKYIKQMVKKEEAFYECMQSFCAPPLTSRDFELCTDPEWEELSRRWKIVSAELKVLAEEEKELRNCFIAMAVGKSTRGAGITVQKIYRKGNIEYSRVPELVGVDLEKYRKGTIETWRLGKEK